MNCFYNEIDVHAVAWLRELISNGHLPQGEVNGKSIKEVQASDLTGYQQAHFFAGIGGWPYALRLAGWPESVPVWTGSCPCQPYSAAGKQKGDADERNLWPDFFRLIRECRPEFVFGEQVASAIRHGWLDGISADLEREGYTVGACVLGAHSVGSPHIRQRLFWVGFDYRNGRETRELSASIDRHRRSFGSNGSNGCRLFNSNRSEFGKQCRSVAIQTEHAGVRLPSSIGYWEKFDLVGFTDGATRRIEPGTFPLVDGIQRGLVRGSDQGDEINAKATAEARTIRLRGYGNAIVPQVAAAFVRAFMESINHG